MWIPCGLLCSARLQAGTVNRGKCPPEGGRCTNFPAVARALQILAPIFLAFFAIVSAGTVCAAQAAAQSSAGPEYTLQSFIQELGHINSALETARPSQDALRAVRESLPAVWSVNAGGHHYNVPTDLLVSRIAKAEEKPELRAQQVNDAREYLDALAAESASLSVQPSAPSLSAESARAKLNTILARPEYAHARQPTWWEKFCERVDELLLDALRRILRGIGGQTSLGYALLWIGVCAAAILIAYWIVGRWIRLAKNEELALQAVAVPTLSWQEWVYTAREAGERGDFRMAIHCAYWAGIARLQDLGALSPDRAKTPRESLRALTKNKMIVPETLVARLAALSMLTSRLEKTWYGYHIATEADFRESLAQLEALGCQLP